MKAQACSCRSHGGFLTAKGLEEAAQRKCSQLELDAMGLPGYLDKVVSVSAVGRDETTFIFDDEVIDEQFRRFREGTEGSASYSGPSPRAR